MFLLNSYSYSQVLEFNNDDFRILNEKRIIYKKCKNIKIKTNITTEINYNKIKIHFLDKNNNEYRMHITRGQKSLGDIPGSPINLQKIEKDVEKESRKEEKREAELINRIKYKKDFAIIKFRLKEKLTKFNSVYSYSYKFKNGKYYIYLTYITNEKTYYSDTIPLYVW
jgi:hypothetical protein